MNSLPYPFYRRRKTRVVPVGQVAVGGNLPIRIQSMTTSDTKDTVSVVREIEALVNAGCEIVRLTVPTMTDCHNLKNIRRELEQKRIKVPLVADIHFTPAVAMEVVPWVEKVRINPGNFADKKFFQAREYTDGDYQKEMARIEERFAPLVEKCRERGVAMRVGTNHGSLSDRIMNRYGDTPQGMVESALEFLRIAARLNYHDIVLSMKASNVKTMVTAYRLLAAKLDEEGMDYPFHLGVTEAGDGEDGRIKSAIGIGTLLEEGLGDTIRVSLTEDSVNEIPVAGLLAAPYNQKFYISSAVCQNEKLSSLRKQGSGYLTHLWIPASAGMTATRFPVQAQLQTIGPLVFGGNEVPRVWSAVHDANEFEMLLKVQNTNLKFEGIEIPSQVYSKEFAQAIKAHGFALAVRSTCSMILIECENADKKAIHIESDSDIQKLIPLLENCRHGNFHLELCFETDFLHHKGFAESLKNLQKLSHQCHVQNFSFSLNTPSPCQDYRFLAAEMHKLALNNPLHLRLGQSELPLLIHASVQLGSLLVDGLGDSIQIESGRFANRPYRELLTLSYGILQGARVRATKTEFIACPSCGRTLFDLQEVTAKIKSRTAHLKGVKIAIMGCVVNGPGEMADADFGYVGTGPGKISLYVGRECVKRGIPEDNALNELIALIKQQGRWMDVPSAN